MFHLLILTLIIYVFHRNLIENFQHIHLIQLNLNLIFLKVMDNYLSFLFCYYCYFLLICRLRWKLLFITSYKSIWKSNEIPALAINGELKFVIIEFTLLTSPINTIISIGIFFFFHFHLTYIIYISLELKELNLQ